MLVLVLVVLQGHNPGGTLLEVLGQDDDQCRVERDPEVVPKNFVDFLLKCYKLGNESANPPNHESQEEEASHQNESANSLLAGLIFENKSLLVARHLLNNELGALLLSLLLFEESLVLLIETQCVLQVVLLALPTFHVESGPDSDEQEVDIVFEAVHIL